MTRRSLAALLAACIAASFGCDAQKPGDATTTGGSGNPSAPAPEKELVKTDVKVGTGPAAANGDLLFVTYTGKLKNGSIFDSNDKPEANPLSLVLGQGSVIKGWELGLVGMKPGGIRKLEIPSKLGYGSQAAPGGSIPPNSDLFFEIKLLDMVKQGEDNVYDKKDLKVGSGKAVTNTSTVTVHYKATLVNGKRFDSTYERKKPETIKLGEGNAIKGFEYGIVGMKPGGKRWLRIPPNIGFGTYGLNNVPGNQVVYFEVELLSVK